MNKISLGDRMKKYENATRIKLTPRTYSIIRIDGKAFHTWTKGFEKPWDPLLSTIIDLSMAYLCENIQGVKFGYTQSDEISLVLTDFDSHETSAWFDSNIQKISSISSSMMTAVFNFEMDHRSTNIKDYALFDSRVFTIPVKYEVLNYFIWRQKDMIRNSISGYAQTFFSHKDLQGKNQDQMKALMEEKNFIWDDLSNRDKFGSGCYRDENGKWIIDDELPNFIENREYLYKIIPNNE